MLIGCSGAILTAPARREMIYLIFLFRFTNHGQKKFSWSLDTFTSMERARLSCAMCSARFYKTCCMSARTTINIATVVVDLTALERSSL
jgi:hypothetical protein